MEMIARLSEHGNLSADCDRRTCVSLSALIESTVMIIQTLEIALRLVHSSVNILLLMNTNIVH